MLCENCHQKEANVKISKLIGSEKIMMIFCLDCAKQDCVSSLLSELSKKFGNNISILINKHLSKKAVQFRQSFQFGIPECFDTVYDQQQIPLWKINKNNFQIVDKNNIMRFSNENSTDDLEHKLEIAIQQENYELAAKLRDRIREIKRDK